MLDRLIRFPRLRPTCPSGLATCALLLATHLHAGVVINEIFYHAPADIADLQWIELHNPTDRAVDLSGWTLSKGVKFTFGEGATIAPQGYTVVCKHREQFEQYYQVAVAGEFDKTLKHGGEPIALRDRGGDVVDTVTFGNRPPWPQSPNGGTASLERICPTVSGARPENWAASPLAANATQPGGSPGRQNSAYSATLPPTIASVTFKPEVAAPGQPINIQATVSSAAALREVIVLYQTVSPGLVSAEQAMAMTKGPTATEYSATLPGAADGHVVRFRIRAVDERSAQRFYPGENENQPALSCLVYSNVPLGKVPFGYLIHTDADQAQRAKRGRSNRGPGPGGPPDEAGMVRMMAEMQLRSDLDVSELWAALTLTNTPVADLERLRSPFARMITERAEIERKTLDSPELPRLAREIPQIVKQFKTNVSETLSLLLNPEQTKALAAWRDRASAGGGPFGFGGSPATMLRQFIRLEPAYFHLSTRTNLSPAQLTTIRDAYRDAIQQRDALAEKAPRFMGPPMGEDNDRAGFQAQLEAIEPAVERRLQGTLTPPQMREFAAWRQQDQPEFMGFRGGGKPPEPARGNDAFVYLDPATRAPRLFDFVHLPERSGGWKVHFARNQELNGMPGLNLIFEASERWVLSEPLAYEFYRRTGQGAPLTDFVRLWVDGQPRGYYLLIEQPNKAFLRRNGLRDDGNLYKATWRGRGLVGQHEKKSNGAPGHDDLIQIVEQVEKAKADPAAQWELIKREFDAGEMINHYAARMVICDWDGFFNNYYLYHDLKGTKKWMLFPWDQDQVWGDPGGFGGMGGLLTTMPLSFGAEGDKPPGWRGDRPPSGMMMGGPGGASWWRAGGYLSKPLLVNPTFRRLFLARIKELLESEFTEARLTPLIDQMRDRLQDEVLYRAELSRDDPGRAKERFERNLASLKEFVTKRRAWLLAQDEIKTGGAYDRTQLK